jgi:hypothetical protein
MTKYVVYEDESFRNWKHLRAVAKSLADAKKIVSVMMANSREMHKEFGYVEYEDFLYDECESGIETLMR